MSNNFYSTFSINIIIICIGLFIFMIAAAESIDHAKIADGSVVVKAQSFSVHFHTERDVSAAQAPVGMRASE